VKNHREDQGREFSFPGIQGINGTLRICCRTFRFPWCSTSRRRCWGAAYEALAAMEKQQVLERTLNCFGTFFFSNLAVPGAALPVTALPE